MTAVLILHLANTVADVYKIDQMNVDHWAYSNHSREFKPFVVTETLKFRRYQHLGNGSTE